MEAISPEPVTDHDEEHEQRQAHRDDQLACDCERIGDEPDQIGAKDEHEEREYEGEELHPFGPSRTADGISDEFVANLRDRLQPARHHRAACRAEDQQRGDQSDDDQHVQRRIGETDLMTAQIEERPEIFDFELMDRIDLHGPNRRLRLAACAAGLPVRALPGAVTDRGGRDEARGAHDIKHARGEAEQDEYNQPPGRDAEQAIDQPTNTGTDHDACNEFAGETKSLSVARCSRCPLRARTFRMTAGRIARLAESFMEPLESRGESGLVGLLLTPVAVFARVAHALDTRGLQRSRPARTLKPRGPY